MASPLTLTCSKFPWPLLMSLADFFDESLIGTIWSSSPCMTSVGTSNFLRSSVKSVSENATLHEARGRWAPPESALFACADRWFLHSVQCVHSPLHSLRRLVPLQWLTRLLLSFRPPGHRRKLSDTPLPRNSVYPRSLCSLALVLKDAV